MAGKAHARHQAEQQQMDDEQNARLDDVQDQQQGQQSYQQAPPPAPAPAPAPAPPSLTDQLNQLAALHQQGALTDEEFSAAKAKLFGS
jgi:hypothetical protein